MTRRVDFSQRACSLSRAVEIVGDRWTLLVLRDVCMGVRRFDDFVAGLGIARNTLSDRLRQLVHHGMVTRVAGPEYVPTDRGTSFFPILLALISWGDRWTALPEGPPRLFRHRSCRRPISAIVVCERCGERIDLDGITSRPGPGADDSGA